jgi:hypothetical protein
MWKVLPSLNEHVQVGKNVTLIITALRCIVETTWLPQSKLISKETKSLLIASLRQRQYEKSSGLSQALLL